MITKRNKYRLGKLAKSRYRRGGWKSIDSEGIKFTIAYWIDTRPDEQHA